MSNFFSHFNLYLKLDILYRNICNLIYCSKRALSYNIDNVKEGERRLLLSQQHEKIGQEATEVTGRVPS